MCEYLTWFLWFDITKTFHFMAKSLTNIFYLILMKIIKNKKHIHNKCVEKPPKGKSYQKFQSIRYNKWVTSKAYAYRITIYDENKTISYNEVNKKNKNETDLSVFFFKIDVHVIVCGWIYTNQLCREWMMDAYQKKCISFIFSRLLNNNFNKMVQFAYRDNHVSRTIIIW